jgi:glyoxylase-like metal-dependent hydrolase (beta-lactamase superfamily II)
LSIPSSADATISAPAPALPDSGATSHRGLIYPWGRRTPAPGEILAIGRGIGWARLPVPGSLDHVNIWAIEDGDGVALIDTGLDIPVGREAWEKLFAGPLAGRRITRLICTHFHPDHIGLAGWLADRFDVALWMSRGEWLMARMLTLDARDVPPPEALAFWRSAGWSEGQIVRATAAGWRRFGRIVSPLPASYVRLFDGQELAIGAAGWQVVIGSGHSPEHACLWNASAGILLAGDQILPRISSNVSVSLHEPQGDPLADWLASIDRLLDLPADTLVLPSHGEPFTGLHVRLAALRDGHHAQLDALALHLAEPRRAVDCFLLLFRRTIGSEELGLATGEAMAHLRRLERDGRARAHDRDGALYFVAD